MTETKYDRLLDLHIDDTDNLEKPSIFKNK